MITENGRLIERKVGIWLRSLTGDHCTLTDQSDTQLTPDYLLNTHFGETQLEIKRLHFGKYFLSYNCESKMKDDGLIIAGPDEATSAKECFYRPMGLLRQWMKDTPENYPIVKLPSGDLGWEISVTQKDATLEEWINWMKRAIGK